MSDETDDDQQRADGFRRRPDGGLEVYEDGEWRPVKVVAGPLRARRRHVDE